MSRVNDVGGQTGFGPIVTEENEPHIADNRRFFVEPLPGRDAALGSPGGASKVGKIGVDTELVAEHS